MGSLAAVQRTKFDNSTIDKVLSLYEVVIWNDEKDEKQ